MKKLFFVVGAVVSLACSLHAQQTTYIFVPTPGETKDSDNNPISDWAGTIVLDSSLNADGSTNDIVSLTLKTPMGIFSPSETAIPSEQTAIENTPVPTPFSWIPTQITSMGWQGEVALPYQGYPVWAWTITDGGLFPAISMNLPDPSVTGTWVAGTATVSPVTNPVGVPDGASTASLLGVVATGLGSFSHLSRKRRV